MFVRIEKLDLLEGITTAIRATGSGQNQPILKCLLIEVSDMGVRITGNSLEMSIQTKPISVIPSTDRINGKIAVDARVLEGIVRALPVGEITISTDMKTHITTVRSRNSEFKIVGSNAEEFPAIDETGKPIGSFSINSGTLRRMIRQTIFCTSKDTSKPVLMGAHVKASNGKVEMCAVDGFRIAHVQENTDYDGDDFAVIIPQKTLVELVRFLPAEKPVKTVKAKAKSANEGEETVAAVITPNADSTTVATMYFNQKKVWFFVEGTKIMSSLIGGEFINYENMFTAAQGTADDVVKANRIELLSAIERATLIGERKHPISLVMNGNVLRIASRTAMGSMDEDVAIESNGKEMAIGFNPSYLMEYLKATGGEQVEMGFTGSLKPSTMRAVGDENYKYLLVPVRMEAPVVNSLSNPRAIPAPAQLAAVAEQAAPPAAA